MGTGTDRDVRAVVVAYRCEPGRGSERGAGWGVVRALSRFARCVVLTSPESGPVLDEWVGGHPGSGVEVVTIDEPGWASTAQRHRIGEFLVYLAWQRRARSAVRAMDRADGFDVAVHASLSAFWLPSIAVDLGVPSVWGPVGGAVTTPIRLWPLLGVRGILDEILDLVAVRTMTLVPSTRRTWRTATVCVAQNRETVRRLPAPVRRRTVVLNHALFHDVDDPAGSAARPDAGGYVAWMSPMESRKGPELAVRAIARTDPDVRMLMVGDGPERSRMEALAADLGVDGRITFTGRVSHDDAVAAIRDAAAAVFTGLREEGGLALAEALLAGTPVVVLDNGGASTLAASAVDPDRVVTVPPTTVDGTVSAMARAITDLWRARSTGTDHPTNLDCDAAMDTYESIVRAAISAG